MPYLDMIVSGGQTGADRAALDWAITHKVLHGGWCPAGRRAEDGPIPAHYALTETPSRSYRQRTHWNVRDSDATLIISLSPELRGGSRATQEIAIWLGKPWLHVHPGIAAVPLTRSFIEEHKVLVLDVAGPRRSTEQGIEVFVEDVLGALEVRK